MSRKVFICSRIGAKNKEEFQKNLRKSLVYARWVALQGNDPEATGFYYCQFLDDFNPEERMLGQMLGRERIEQCQLVMVVSDGREVSQGMQEDIEKAIKHGKLRTWKKAEDIVAWLKKEDPALRSIFPDIDELFENETNSFKEHNEKDVIETQDDQMTTDKDEPSNISRGHSGW